jgi:membrane-associated phospholipid phosphatase
VSRGERRRRALLGLDLGHPGPEPLPVLRRRLLLAGVVLLVLAAALTAVVAGNRSLVQGLDDRFRELMVSLHWQPLVTAARVLSVAFGTAVSWPLRALVTLVIVLRRHWVALGAWVCTVVLSELAIGPVKALVDRPRPPGAEVVTSAASYPSGHAIASAVTAMGIVMALTTGRRRLHWMVGAVLIAASVALSRTYLSAHWLTDVLGGSLIGAGLALAVPEAFEVVRDRRSPGGERVSPLDRSGRDPGGGEDRPAA